MLRTMSSLELFVWAIAGGVFIVLVTVCTSYFNNGMPSSKHLSRDFLLGAAFTGFVFPLLPETFDTMKGAITTTAAGVSSGLGEAIATTATSSLYDPGVKVGPANF